MTATASRTSFTPAPLTAVSARPITVGVSTFAADNGRSGIGTYIINMLSEFAELDAFRFEAFTTDADAKVLLDDADAIRRLPVSNAVRSPLVNLLWHQFVMPDRARQRRHDVLFLPAANRRVPASAPCPMVGTVHDLAALHIHDKYGKARGVYVRQVIPWLIRRLDRVITVSEYTKRDVTERAGVDPARVVVIPNGLDHGRFHPRDVVGARRVASALGVDGPYILYTARIEHPGKNHVRLIRAFERARRAGIPHTLVLAGSDWDRADVVHQAAQSSSAASHIRFTGFVPGGDLPDLIAAADLLAFPSLFEGFGLPVLEAMACGVPVACSNSSSLPEVAGDAAVMFHPEDDEAMSQAMLTLLTDPRTHRRYATLGIARAAMFTWSETARRTAVVLADAARGLR